VSEPHSIKHWVQSLESGDRDAADALWRCCFEPLVRLARKQLHGAPRAVSDEEDAAMDAVESFCRCAARGGYPKLESRDDLSKLLAVITGRKACDQARRERRRRGGGRIRLHRLVDEANSGRNADRFAFRGPAPDEAALSADECDRLFDRLRDDTLRIVARLRMEGYTNEEVASRLGCGVRTVARKLEVIRRAWQDEFDVEP
jgi:DNA-directed RNA polymerase specialized sigma24 family protein